MGSSAVSAVEQDAVCSGYISAEVLKGKLNVNTVFCFVFILLPSQCEDRHETGRRQASVNTHEAMCTQSDTPRSRNVSSALAFVRFTSCAVCECSAMSEELCLNSGTGCVKAALRISPFIRNDPNQSQNALRFAGFSKTYCRRRVMRHQLLWCHTSSQSSS